MIARMRPELRFSILLAEDAEDVSEKPATRRRGEGRLASALGLRHYRSWFLKKTRATGLTAISDAPPVSLIEVYQRSGVVGLKKQAAAALLSF
jgi:hypothetical protein